MEEAIRLRGAGTGGEGQKGERTPERGALKTETGSVPQKAGDGEEEGHSRPDNDDLSF